MKPSGFVRPLSCTRRLFLLLLLLVLFILLFDRLYPLHRFLV
jgi:hypothetical protein